MGTYAEQRRAKLVEILGDRSTPREERIERVSRFVEEEVRHAFVRGVRGNRGSSARPPRAGAPLVREEVAIEEDEL
jgi:hypothetical protein